MVLILTGQILRLIGITRISFRKNRKRQTTTLGFPVGTKLYTTGSIPYGSRGSGARAADGGVPGAEK